MCSLHEPRRALASEDILAWLEAPAHHRRRVAAVPLDRERLLDRLVESLERPLGSGGGTLAALRYGFKQTRQLDLCQFGLPTR